MRWPLTLMFTTLLLAGISSGVQSLSAFDGAGFDPKCAERCDRGRAESLRGSTGRDPAQESVPC